ncbi:ATP-binding protein [Desulfovibrio inopinatus]|uniref:ATP-binding protein n=1 Tax=Desulfovibrio inopinatus TaxID=102109 RepID=UPI00041D81D8|nr:ATP-binding protein [Desulfovibrio inopinatus]
MAQRIAVVTSVAGAKVFAELDGEMKDLGRIGSLVKIKTPQSLTFGMIGSAKRAETDHGIKRIIEINLLGEALEFDEAAGTFKFQRGVSYAPNLDEEVFPTVSQDLAQIYSKPKTSNVQVGWLYQDTSLPAYVVTDALLGKHFAVLGTSGSGKSCTVAVILRSVLNALPNGHIVLLDPHDEYSRCFGEKANIITTDNLELPYWFLNFEETVEVLCSGDEAAREMEAAILKDAIYTAKFDYVSKMENPFPLTVDTPTPYRLNRLVEILKEGMGKLDKPESSLPYMRIMARLDSLKKDRRFAFMFSSLVVQDVMPDVLSQILRIPSSDKPITIFNISGVPSEIVDVVVSLLCRTIFDFNLWSPRGGSAPVLLVCEEAHRYIPTDESKGFGPTRKAIARIAKEGRKYGVSLGLVTQRPSELSESILSQCNTLFALRMSNEHDQRFVERAMPENAAGLLASLPALRTQEAIAVGEGVTVPMRIRMNDLDEAHRPHSDTAAFSLAWKEDSLSTDFVRNSIERWRRQKR